MPAHWPRFFPVKTHRHDPIGASRRFFAALRRDAQQKTTPLKCLDRPLPFLEENIFLTRSSNRNHSIEGLMGFLQYAASASPFGQAPFLRNENAEKAAPKAARPLFYLRNAQTLLSGVLFRFRLQKTIVAVLAVVDDVDLIGIGVAEHEKLVSE